MSNKLSYKDPANEQRAIVALATFQDDEKALELLKAQGIQTTVKTLANKRLSKADDVARVRREIAPALEEQLTGDMLDLTRLSVELEGYALDNCLKKLQASRFAASPEVLAKIAREASQVKTQNVDKRLALEGRPTSITESRNQDEIIRSLESMGVARQITVEGSAIEE